LLKLKDIKRRDQIEGMKANKANDEYVD